MSRTLIIASSLAMMLVGCTAAQLDTARDYQNKIAGACGVAMTLAPLAGSVAPWIIAGCSTEQAIAKLALDPSSLLWVTGLITKAKGGA